ncbi:CDP-alcohol phosphatidyltransferase [Ventosimonas gracilis]|uniref:CDP-alcohol phosphatidyltransferase n=1 Tax=Ventosimonas gracilis TaxID=1680762 RepID=A0A139SR10_9GAMM|nr:CDP-alcohol phosphatidyltransferase family protein [Ventosimonas gracilis]KXU37045.1 CDP-alcohol phosphatidyltransferase [Ventosimonas gracilis]
MPSIYQLKPAFQNLLRPLVRRLAAIGVTANQVTLAAALLSVLLGAILALFSSIAWLFVLLPLWMLLRMALNAIDGMLAREFAQQSKLGAYLNELCDLIADSALYLPFALLPGIDSRLVVVLALLAVISEYAGVLGPMVGSSRRYDGPLGKSDRAFAFGLIGLCVALGWPDAFWINALLALLIALSLATLYNRVRQGLRESVTTN